MYIQGFHLWRNTLEWIITKFSAAVVGCHNASFYTKNLLLTNGSAVLAIAAAASYFLSKQHIVPPL
jgi:hypothetical protein